MMEEIATIQFQEIETSDQGLAVIRRSKDAVAIALSLQGNGDIEAVMTKEDARRLLKALQAAVE